MSRLKRCRTKLAKTASALAEIDHEPKARVRIIEKLADVKSAYDAVLKVYHLCPQEIIEFKKRKLRNKRQR